MQMASMVNEGFALDPPGYERLNSWTYVLMHLQTARANFDWIKDYAIDLDDLVNINRYQAFLVAAIVAYCRCYASTGPGIQKLDAKKVYSGSSDGMEVHRRLMALRNTFAAHADRNDLTRVTLAVKDDGDQIIIRHVMTNAMPVHEILDFLEAVDHTEHFAIAQLNRQLDKLGIKLGKTITLD